ncbi:DUF4387 domain-containing protein [Pseudooceanicola onchidii]|uniref:DUF4387 domain-containing protein n=1 Tax=Pseudooceanicola onchidii TaxID=2562279 RepID=UPI0010A9F0F8|nr:DUF4387 domain-containing protein [Pseudooceanicola onchidii]
MTRLKDVARYVRSKNAGPFWVTIDVFFPDDHTFEACRSLPALSARSIGAIYGREADEVKRFEVPSLRTIKLSFPRRSPQGAVEERDMHSGQSYVRLLDLELGNL